MPAGAAESVAGSDQVVEVTGTLTDEGVECQVMRSDDGKLYTLLGDLEDFKMEDHVYIRGQIAEVSFCMQGTTINVEIIEAR